MELPTRRLLVLSLLAAAAAVLLLWPDGDQERADPSAVAPPAARAVGTVVADDDPPPSTAPAGLQPGLERAVAAAMSAAGEHGYSLSITSGFRTAEEQRRLLIEAIDEHGSEEEALRWVFPPERSMHVQGYAVDMGDRRAAEWLEEHGASYGLCRTLSWEWWHFEWRPSWEDSRTCPSPVDEPEDAPGAWGSLDAPSPPRRGAS